MTWTGPAAGREVAQRTAPAGHRHRRPGSAGARVIDPARPAA